MDRVAVQVKGRFGVPQIGALGIRARARHCRVSAKRHEGFPGESAADGATLVRKFTTGLVIRSDRVFPDDAG